MATRDQNTVSATNNEVRSADFFINVTSTASGKPERVGVFACYVADKDGKTNGLEQAILDFLLEGGSQADILETLEFSSIELNKQHKGESQPKAYTFGKK